MTKNARQLGFKGVSGWGGKRRGAGRPNRTKTVNHMRREPVDFKKPLQITQKLKPGLTTLRRKDLLAVFKKCAARVKRFDMHVVQFSLLSNHIHMIVEAKDNEALGSGMCSLMSTLAKAVARLSKVNGKVFLGRYHLRVITSPTQMKRSLGYVLLNQAKHTDMLETMDPFSSAKYFPHWRQLMGRKWNGVLDWEIRGVSTRLEGAGLSPPQSWLARVGWMRAR